VHLRLGNALNYEVLVRALNLLGVLRRYT